MQLAFYHEDIRIDFEYKFSKRRKTVAIIIEPPGLVRVIAPAGTTRKTIIESVSNRAPWIISKLQIVKQSSAGQRRKEFVSGEIFQYLGEEYRLRVSIDQNITKVAVNLCQGTITVDTPCRETHFISQALEDWYRVRAAQCINARIDHYRSIINACPAKVTIRNQKTRWGSCSARGNLNFNWKIVMAPSHVLDYLVVHEMCHLIHHNHSREFWDLVGAILPDYLAGQAWLKKNGIKLAF